MLLASSCSLIIAWEESGPHGELSGVAIKIYFAEDTLEQPQGPMVVKTDPTLAYLHACVEWMIKEENKIHVARHIDLLQESSNIVPNRAEWTTSARCSSVSVSRCGSAAVRLTPDLRAGTCRHWNRAKRTDPGAQNRASVPAACSDRRNSDAPSRSAFQFDRLEEKFSSEESKEREQKGEGERTLSWLEPAAEESPAAGVRRMRTSPGFFMRKH
ncbi:hypothetical protein NQZ68_033012 [Dissostichus eleginoides]|nr:hypothetical protein NQZ68_033012 [Dissostichus eleginoides]